MKSRRFALLGLIIVSGIVFVVLGERPTPATVQSKPVQLKPVPGIDPRALREPKVVSSTGSSIDYALVVKMRSWLKTPDGLMLVPDGTPNALQLRTYGSPKNYAKATVDAYLANDANLDWTIPGPTFRTRLGQAINIRLINRLPIPALSDHDCNPGSPPSDSAPNCFHGDNTTNLHYHGFRVSPNPPQDWVFLQLRPQGSASDPHDPTVFVGEYSFHIDPLSDVQPVGSHWYHPHKHGSTAVQVVNGMAGAFIVEGYFDDYLRQQVPGLQEKTLVMQQINESVPLAGAQGPNDKSIWVNGQKNPIIELGKGEVQRWRFIGANQQASADVVLSFPNIEVRQIAQDGVPFADANYQVQPLDLSTPGAYFRGAIRDRLPLGSAVRARLASELAVPDGSRIPMFSLGPGNRVDVLVRAPAVPGDYPITLEHASNNLADELLTALGVSAPGDNNVVTLRVTDRDKPMSLPGQLPPVPAYLTDIVQPAFAKTVNFHADKGPGPQPAPPVFFIDGVQYDPGRIDHFLEIGRDEQWRLTNTAGSGPNAPIPSAHPFHIHVNTFQLVEVNGQPLPRPWIWFDTLALPTHSASSVSGEGSLVIFQRFLRFTGQYVLHCHILGHEDRGMMQNVLAR